GQESPAPHGRTHPGGVARPVQPLRRAQRLHHADLGRAEHQPRQPVLPLPGQGRADQLAVRPLRACAVGTAQRERRRARRGGRLVLHAHPVRADLAVPLPVPRPERSAVQEPAAGDALPVGAEEQDPRRARHARRHEPLGRREHRLARGRSHRHQHGGGADLLAELRVRARPAPRAGTRKRAGGLVTWSPPRAQSAGTLPRNRPAHAPAGPGRRVHRGRAV
ncbi:MAG: Transcriptional regulator, AcrR family, partial [uncultured Ramlibacter sp.]